MLDVQPGERILEIGCGTGESLSVLGTYTGGIGQVFGLDLSSGMLHVAKNKIQRLSLSNIVCLQGNGLCLPFAGKSFDAVFMSFTLELFSSVGARSILNECKRVLRKGGRLGVVSLLQKPSPNWMERFYGWAHLHYPRVIDCRPIPIEDIVREAGFEISKFQEMSMWGLTVGILIASKNR